MYVLIIILCLFIYQNADCRELLTTKEKGCSFHKLATPLSKKSDFNADGIHAIWDIEDLVGELFVMYRILNKCIIHGTCYMHVIYTCLLCE